jgi:hypothetical protein
LRIAINPQSAVFHWRRLADVRLTNQNQERKMRKFNGLLAIIISISAIGIVAEARRSNTKKKAAEIQCKDENPSASKKEIRECVKEKLKK